MRLRTHYSPTSFIALIFPPLHFCSRFAVGTVSFAFGVRMNERSVLSGTLDAFAIFDSDIA